MFSIFQETQERLAQEEEARLATEQAKKKAELEIKELKKDIDELEIAVSKVLLPPTGKSTIRFFSKSTVIMAVFTIICWATWH